MTTTMILLINIAAIYKIRRSLPSLQLRIVVIFLLDAVAVAVAVVVVEIRPSSQV
jgi:hypothetical protein